MLTFIVTNITTHDEIKELENLFKKLDTNQDGKLSKEELIQGSVLGDAGYSQLYPHLDQRAIDNMVTSIIQQADYNHSGQIDYTEYLVSAINKEKLLTKDKLNKAFELFDLVGDSHIGRRRADLQRRMGGLFRQHQDDHRRLEYLPRRCGHQQRRPDLARGVLRLPGKDGSPLTGRNSVLAGSSPAPAAV